MLKKVLKAFGIFLLVLLVALLLIPFIFKEQLNNKVKAELSNQLNAKVDYAGFSWSLLPHFPLLSFSLNGFSITGMGDFKSDTLALVKEFGFTLDLKTVMSGNAYRLTDIHLVEPRIKAIVNTEGKANWNILRLSTASPKTDSEVGTKDSSIFSFEVNSVFIKNAAIVYEDKRNNSQLEMTGVDFTSEPGNTSYKAIRDIGGQVIIAGVIYDSDKFPVSLKGKNIELSYTPELLTLKQLSGNFGKSDFAIDGTLKNPLPYFLGNDSLTGTLNVKSNVLDVNEWMEKKPAIPVNSPAPQSLGLSTVVQPQALKIPARVDFTITAKVNKVYYQKLALENVKGPVVIKDQALDIKGLSVDLLGGNAKINTSYNSKLADGPEFSFDYKTSNLVIQYATQQLDMMDKIVPFLKSAHGRISSTLTGTGKIKSDGSMDYNTLEGNGTIQSPDIRIDNVPVLDEIGKAAKTTALQNLETKDLKSTFHFKSGRVTFDPAMIKFTNGYDVHVQGSHGFDQTMNYDLQLDVPTKEFGGVASLAQGILSSFNIAMPKAMSFYFTIKGNQAKPDVNLDHVGTGN